MIDTVCPCGRVHAAAEVICVGRYKPGGAVGWRDRQGRFIRSTRSEAQLDVCPHWCDTRDIPPAETDGAS